MAVAMAHRQSVSQFHTGHDTPASRRTVRARIARTQRTRPGIPLRLSELVTNTRLLRLGYGALVVCAAVAIALSAAARIDRPTPDAWSAITVGESGTLWAIAQAHPVPGLSTADTVALIKESNLLDSAVIMPGQTLRVPAQPSSAVAVASR